MKSRIIFFVCLFGIGFQAFSGAATVLYTYKKVSVKSGGGERALSRGSALNPGDTITTEGGGLVNIKYSNGTLVNLGENSSYTIVAYNPQQKNMQSKTTLNAGKLRLKTTGKTQEEITTPIVALGILGTDASIYVSSSSSLYVHVSEGKVEGKGATIGAGDSVLIDSKGVTPTPFPQQGTVAPPTGAQGTIAGSPVGTQETPRVTGIVETVATSTTATLGVATTSVIITVPTTVEIAQIAEIAAICP